MPPKAKKEKKARKKSILLDDVDTTVLTREKLEEFCVAVYEAIVKERQNIEFLRVDRDKLANMVAISREQLTVAKDAMLSKQKEIQDTEDRHRVLMWENRVKLGHLASDSNIQVLSAKLESVKKMSEEQVSHEKRMAQLESDASTLRAELKALEVDFAEARTKKEIKQAEKKSKIREEDKQLHMLMESSREKIYNNKNKELEVRFEQEYKHLNQRKDKEVALLLKNNIKFTTDLKHYYNGIVNRNLSVINHMRNEFQSLKTKTAATEKQCSELKKENAFLVLSWNQSKMAEARLQMKLSSSEKDQNQLKSVKRQLEDNRMNLENQKIELNVLEMRVEKQQDFAAQELRKANEELLKMRIKVEEMILLLEMMAEHLYHRNKEADATLGRLKVIYRDKGEARPALETIPEYQNTSLDEMNYQITTVAAQRSRILRAYKELLRRNHLHMDDTGFTTLDVEDILKSAVSFRVIVNEEVLLD